MRNLSLDLIRVTEAGAIAASRFIGSGDKEGADQAATVAMRDRLNGMDFCAQIVIGEGKKDNSYGLFEGELVGGENNGCLEPEYDIAVDPIEGTRPTVTAGPEAISTLAVAHKDCMYKTDSYYMNKLAFGPQIGVESGITLAKPLTANIALLEAATEKNRDEILVCVLDRARHTKLISDLRNLGVRVKLIQDCDVSGSVATCMDTGIDLMLGVGGAPEAVLSAAAIKCMGGHFEAQDVSMNGQDFYDMDPLTFGPILTLEDLVKDECVFVATGITDGSLLDGVTYHNNSIDTHSLFMRSFSGTWRDVRTTHRS